MIGTKVSACSRVVGGKVASNDRHGVGGGGLDLQAQFLLQGEFVRNDGDLVDRVAFVCRTAMKLDAPSSAISTAKTAISLVLIVIRISVVSLSS